MRSRCCLLFLFAVSASAQDFREQIEVDVVEVPVHVTRRGKAVAGLTQDLFELSINGKPHPIEYFDVVDARGVAASRAASADAPAPARVERRTLTVLLFDTVATSHRDLLRASEAAQKFVKEAPPSETFAVARLNADGVQFLVPFTKDRGATLRAVRTLQPSRARDALGLVTLDVERTMTVADIAPAAMQTLPDAAVSESGVSSDRAGAAIGRLMRGRDNANREIRTGNEIRAAEYLGLLADNLAPINGVKHVILFAEGGGRVSEPKSASRMHAKFQAASVILNAVELETMRIPAYSDVEERVESGNFRAVVNASDSLYTLALGTGGTVTRHSDIVAGLRLLREMQGVTYILGFRPPKTDTAHNEIRVKVNEQPRGTTVTYRRGYTTGSRVNRNQSLFLADVMANDVVQRGLTVDLRVDRQPAGANVVVSVPGKELLAREVDGPQSEVDVYLYVFNDQNAVVEWAYWRLVIDLEKGRPYLSAFPYEIERLFTTLRPGRFSVKALLRFPKTDVIAFQRADFEIASAR